MASSYSGLSPSQVASRRRIAQSMLSGDATSPVGHWTQALARVAEGGVGAYLQNTADKSEAEGRRRTNELWTRALTNKAPMRDVAAALMGDSGGWGDEAGQSLAVASMKQDAERDSPEYQVNLETAGLKRDKLKQELEGFGATTDDIKEFMFAQKNGFGGGFMDYLSAKKQGGAAPAGYRWSTTNPGQQEAIEGGPASKLPAETAGKVGMMRVAVSSLPAMRNIFLGEQDEKTGKRSGATINAFDYYANRGTTGEGYRLGVGAIESVLRAASGAAVPETEVTRYAGLFLPSYVDTDETKGRKLDSLERWISTMLSAIQEGRPVSMAEAEQLARGMTAGQEPPTAAQADAPATPAPTGGTWPIKRLD